MEVLQVVETYSWTCVAERHSPATSVFASFGRLLMMASKQFDETTSVETALPSTLVSSTKDSVLPQSRLLEVSAVGGLETGVVGYLM